MSVSFLVLKNSSKWGFPLVVQRLGICLPMQGTQVHSLVQEDPMCHRVTRPRATTAEPEGYNY